MEGKLSNIHVDIPGTKGYMYKLYSALFPYSRKFKQVNKFFFDLWSL